MYAWNKIKTSQDFLDLLLFNLTLFNSNYVFKELF